MTCLVAAIGLAPAAVATGIGSQVQKPLALVVVGGMTLAPVLILLVLPLLINRFSSRVAGPRKRAGQTAMLVIPQCRMKESRHDPFPDAPFAPHLCRRRAAGLHRAGGRLPAKAPPVSESVAVPMPPTPAGSAPPRSARPADRRTMARTQMSIPARRWPRIGGRRSAARRSTAWWIAR
jgi:hypothetical protein